MWTDVIKCQHLLWWFLMEAAQAVLSYLWGLPFHYAPPYLKRWAGFQNHPEATQIKCDSNRHPLSCLSIMNSVGQGAACGHSALCWFKNSICNPTQCTLFPREAVSVKKKQRLLFQPVWKSLKEFDILTIWSIHQSFCSTCVETYVKFACLIFQNRSTKALFGPWLIALIKTLIIDLSFTLFIIGWMGVKILMQFFT